LAALFCAKLRLSRHLESVTSSQKFDSVDAKNILVKFHLGAIWKDGALGFFEEVGVAPRRRRRRRTRTTTTTTTTTTTWAAIWDQFL